MGRFVMGRKVNSCKLISWIAFMGALLSLFIPINIYAETSVQQTSLISFSVDKNIITKGETAKFNAEISTMTKISSARVVYKAPNGNARKSIELNLNTKTGKYEGTLTADDYDAPGEWKLEFIDLQDIQNNNFLIFNGPNYVGVGYEYRDLSPYAITINGTMSDHSPPEIQEITLSSKVVTQDETLKLSADVIDDLSGVDYMIISYRAPIGYSKKGTRLDLNPETGKYEGFIEFGKYDISGSWKIDHIIIRDKQGNYIYLYDSKDGGEYQGPGSDDRDLSEYSFYVKDTISDYTPPNLNNIKLNLREIKRGGQIKVTANITDELSGVRAATVSYKAVQGYSRKYVDLYLNEKVGTYEGFLDIRENDPLGAWKVEYIYLDDMQRNYLYIFDSNDGFNYIGPENTYQDLSDLTFLVKDNDSTPPKTNIFLAPANIKVGDWYNSIVNVTLNGLDQESGVAKTMYRLNNGEWNIYAEPLALVEDGVYKIEYKSVDYNGNEEKINTKKINIDKTSPSLDISFDHSVITTRNHKMIPIIVSVDTKDLLSKVKAYKLVSVISNQADEDKKDGKTKSDVQGAEFNTPDKEFSVRAEVSDNEDRIYTVTYEATDYAGNKITVSKDIIVKSNNSNK